MRAESEIREMLPEVNDIFEQVGMTFYIDSVVVTNVDGACQPVFDGPARPYNLSFDDVANILPDAGGLKCYFVDSFIDFKRTRAGNDDCGMLLTKQADAISWAHEIGHACGLEDIYDENNGQAIPINETFEHRHAPDDWNGGSDGTQTKGSRYYRKSLTRCELVKSLLMYGYGSRTKADISAGSVDGVVNLNLYTSCFGFAETGIFDNGGTRSPEHHRKSNNGSEL